MSPRMRFVLALFAAFFLAVPGLAATPVVSPVITPADHLLGNPKAKVTIIEYGSVACPICGRFNVTVMPDLKTKYIDTGKARYVFRPMLTGVPTIAVAGTRLAECAGKDRYFDVVDKVMRGQAEYYAWGENDMLARPVLLRIASDFGFNEDAYNKCVLDAAAIKALNASNRAYIEAGIDSTPTFFINGKRFEYHGGGIAEFDKAIAAAQ